ncbi:MAG: hypothetical protein GTO49_34175 [Anaerolineae bacterium]|nr:hypothetical protein [Anaerolineae bacterium]
MTPTSKSTMANPPTRRRPFSGISASQWVNLALPPLALSYLLYLLLSVHNRGLFEYVGIDYGMFRASA